MKYKLINKDWRIESSLYPSCSEKVYKWRGAEMFGIFQSFLFPETNVHFFKTDYTGFRQEINETEFYNLIKKIS